MSRRSARKAETVGDDIAWMRFGADGRLYAVNPETGFIGTSVPIPALIDDRSARIGGNRLPATPRGQRAALTMRSASTP